jgi:hypothetical protein
MNKKLLGFALASIFLAMLVAPVMAGKGQTKQDYDYLLVGYTGEGGTQWVTPDGVIQGRDVPFVADSIDLLIGGVPMTVDPETYTGTMDYTIDAVSGLVDIRVHETFEVEGLGIISQKTAESITGYLTPDVAAEGYLVGFGSDGLDGVKISGLTEMTETGALHRFGTVMGWPT